MSYEDQRRRYQQQRAERQIVEQAAAHLSHQAILAAYAGLEHKELAFGLALILDELARHFRDLDEQLRARVLDGSVGCSANPDERPYPRVQVGAPIPLATGEDRSVPCRPRALKRPRRVLQLCRHGQRR